MQDYTTKPEAYFANPRKDIQPLLPEHASRVLEVGCGTGATLRWLKESGCCQTTVGMELFESAAALARPHVDEVVVGNAEQLVETAFAPESFDLVLCLDVLEHMVEPWAFVAKVDRLLKPGGVLISSIPNTTPLVRHRMATPSRSSTPASTTCRTSLPRSRTARSRSSRDRADPARARSRSTSCSRKVSAASSRR